MLAGRERTWFDRLAAAYPLVVSYVLLLILYGWQVSKHSAPWNFIDELQWAALSRGVAHTGRPELRSHPAAFHSLYTYFLAPAWWLGATAKAYAAAKYLNAAAAAAALFPAYGLARLFVPRVAAYVVAIATAVTPAVAYAGMLIPESLAYLWSTLVLFLVARALVRPGRRTAVSRVRSARGRAARPVGARSAGSRGGDRGGLRVRRLRARAAPDRLRGPGASGSGQRH